MDRFVVFQIDDEWLVTYGDRRQVAFTTRKKPRNRPSMLLTPSPLADTPYQCSSCLIGRTQRLLTLQSWRGTSPRAG